MAGEVEEHSDTDEALLELLLSYAIPRKDVHALARTLITHFGTLIDVLAADIYTLCTFDGIKARTAVLLKLADKIRTHHTSNGTQPADHRQSPATQETLFDLPILDGTTAVAPKRSKPKAQRIIRPRRGTELFGKAVLKEAIQLLPQLPETESLDTFNICYEA